MKKPRSSGRPARLLPRESLPPPSREGVLLPSSESGLSQGAQSPRRASPPYSTLRKSFLTRTRRDSASVHRSGLDLSPVSDPGKNNPGTTPPSAPHVFVNRFHAIGKTVVFFLQAVHPLFTEFKLVRQSFQTLHHLGCCSPPHRRTGQNEAFRMKHAAQTSLAGAALRGSSCPRTAGRLQTHTRLFFNLEKPTIVVALCQCVVTTQQAYLGFYFSNSKQVRVRVSPSRGIFRARRPSCGWTGTSRRAETPAAELLLLHV